MTALFLNNSQFEAQNCCVSSGKSPRRSLCVSRWSEGWPASCCHDDRALDGQVAWSHSSWMSALVFAALLWGAIAAPVLATVATYVNMHRVVVGGLLLEWFLFVVGVSMACWRWAT